MYHSVLRSVTLQATLTGPTVYIALVSANIFLLLSLYNRDYSEMLIILTFFSCSFGSSRGGISCGHLPLLNLKWSNHNFPLRNNMLEPNKFSFETESEKKNFFPATFQVLLAGQINRRK